jgi:hypothetical protein
MKNSILKSMRAAVVASLSALMVSAFWTPALGQDTTGGTYERFATVPTEVSGVSTFMEPPARFNPLEASDQELAMYGFPPRPDKTANPQHYESWARMMIAPKVRWNGPLKLTAHKMSAPATAKPVQTAQVNYQIQYENPSWSGFGNYKPISSYNTSRTSLASISTAEAVFNVPIVEDPYGVSGCENNANGIVNLMVGIDAPWLTAGVLADNPGWIEFSGCSVFTPTYYAQIGAGTSTRILQEFAVNSGDTVFVEVWDTSSTMGYAYIYDETTFVYATYAITLMPIVGNSAQFLMSRVYSNGSNTLTPLPNYTKDFWSDVWAMDFSGRMYGPGTNTTTSTTIWYQMSDDAGDQETSYPTAFTQTFHTGGAMYSIDFQAMGCARYFGCTP